MKINYRILDYNEKEHSMIVRYFTDNITEVMLCSYTDANGDPVLTEGGWPVRCRSDYNMTFFDNKTPTTQDVQKLVERNAPALWLKLQEEIEDPVIEVSMEAVKPLVGKSDSFTFEFVAPQTPPEVPLPPVVEGGEVTLQSLMNTLNAIIASSNTAGKVVLVTE